MAQNTREPTRDTDHLPLRRAGCDGKGDGKSDSDRRKPFQCVEGENQIAPLLSKHSQDIGGANIPAPVFPDVNSADARDEEPVWARAEEIPNTRCKDVNEDWIRHLLRY